MFAMTSIKGIDCHFSNIVCKKADIDMNKGSDELNAAELDSLVVIWHIPADEVKRDVKRSSVEAIRHIRIQNDSSESLGTTVVSITIGAFLCVVSTPRLLVAGEKLLVSQRSDGDLVSLSHGYLGYQILILSLSH
ncbi:hypothetical protein AAHA92_09987 [Salvia divinorum]|uniref:Uncharacterized protein n=1 Tax=Salvia divinorum TaxID=28513 RepID=A0ABD1HT68_SALDI